MALVRRPALLLLCLVAVSACVTRRIPEPAQLSVPGPLTEAQIESSILAALARQPTQYLNESDALQHVWFFESSAPGVVYAAYKKKRHYLHVAVHYDIEKVVIKIVGSENLRQSSRRIHKVARLWVDDLQLRIRRSLSETAARPANRLPPGLASSAAILVAPAADGAYGARTYPGSGQLATNAVVHAFSGYVVRVETAPAPRPVPELLQAARKHGFTHLAIPLILRWEDRATEWSGIRDKLSLKLSILDVRSGRTVDSVVINERSRWATFGGDHPQDLLDEPLRRYAASLFR